MDSKKYEAFAMFAPFIRLAYGLNILYKYKERFQYQGSLMLLGYKSKTGKIIFDLPVSKDRTIYDEDVQKQPYKVMFFSLMVEITDERGNKEYYPTVLFFKRTRIGDDTDRMYDAAGL